MLTFPNYKASRVRTDKGSRSAHVARCFDSLADVSRYLAETPRAADQLKSSQGPGYGTDWDLDAGYDGALSLAQNGWREHCPTADGIAETVAQSLASKVTTVRERRRGVHGQTLSMGHYLAGAPDCAVHVRRNDATVTGSVVRLAFGISANCNVSAQTMLSRGIAMTALILTLQSAGYSVEATAVSNGRGTHDGFGSDTYSVRTVVKRAGEWADSGDLLFAVAHPAMFRRLMFGVMERETERLSYGYGCSLEALPADMVADVRIDSGLAWNDHACKTDPAGWVLSKLKGLGLATE